MGVAVAKAASLVDEYRERLMHVPLLNVFSDTLQVFLYTAFSSPEDDGGIKFGRPNISAAIGLTRMRRLVLELGSYRYSVSVKDHQVGADAR